jgi:hypothetical protein
MHEFATTVSLKSESGRAFDNLQATGLYEPFVRGKRPNPATLTRGDSWNQSRLLELTWKHGSRITT